MKIKPRIGYNINNQVNNMRCNKIIENALFQTITLMKLLLSTIKI